MIHEPEFHTYTNQKKHEPYLSHKSSVIINSRKISYYVFCVHKFTIVFISYCLMTDSVIITKK